MITRTLETYPSFKLFTTSLHHQLYITASVTQHETDAERMAEDIYNKIAEILSASSSQIILERCFGNIDFQNTLLGKRNQIFRKHSLPTDTPVTYVEGASCCESIFSGVQIRALKGTPENKIRTIMDEGISRGRAWVLDHATFFMLQDIDGGKPSNSKYVDPKKQSETMFRQAERILHAEGAAYQDVVRTWIYISNILDWYDDFNVARNTFYSNYGIIGNEKSREQVEQLYLPASTGIEGKNSSNLPSTMDVFAIHRSPESTIQIHSLYGTKQRSPLRYGSAFSRAVVIEESDSKLIQISGTASIDEQGKSVFIGDSEAQIRHTLKVISSLIKEEGATLQDFCETTVFFKHKRDISVFEKIARELGIPDIPSVNVTADICRDELLFELDAALILEKNRTQRI
jgi:enamine deaminase RidA (YjgF/YER057c/UK114 family)